MLHISNEIYQNRYKNYIYMFRPTECRMFLTDDTLCIVYSDLCHYKQSKILFDKISATNFWQALKLRLNVKVLLANSD